MPTYTYFSNTKRPCAKCLNGKFSLASSWEASIWDNTEVVRIAKSFSLFGWGMKSK